MTPINSSPFNTAIGSYLTQASYKPKSAEPAKITDVALSSLNQESASSSSSSEVAGLSQNKHASVSQKDAADLNQRSQEIRSATSLTLLDLKTLQQIEAERSCEKRTIGEHLKECTNVEELKLGNITIEEFLTAAPYFKDLVKLTKLKIILIGDADLDPVVEIPNLEQLDLMNCINLSKLPTFKQNSKLQAIYLAGCWNIKSFGGLENCSNLVWIGSDWCASFASLEDLKKIKFDIAKLKQLPPWEGIFLRAILPNVETNTKISGNRALSIQALRSLKERIIAHTGKDHSIHDVLAAVRHYPWVDFSEAKSEEIDAIRQSYNKTNHSFPFYITRERAKSLSELPRLDAAVYLDVTNSTDLMTLKELKASKNLTTLKIRGCNKIASLNPLKNLTKLRHLSVEGVQVCDWELKDLQRNLPNLKIEGKNVSSFWTTCKYGFRKFMLFFFGPFFNFD